MISRHLRVALFGGLLGLMVALTPGCQKKCAPDNCTGCCNDKNECLTSAGEASCGLSGAACSSCSADQVCTNGACVPNTPGVLPDGGLADGGTIDAGPPPCVNDFSCGPGQICDVLTGMCGPGQNCSEDYQCQALNAEDRCYTYGQQCTCDTTDGGGGTCRLRKGPCEECQADSECGSDPIIFGPPGHIGAGRCKALPNDTSGKKYCRYQRISSQCTCGTVDDGTGFCVPASNSCTSVGCNIDTDCPSGSVCSVNRPDAGANSCGGTCMQRCRWDFATHEVTPGCAPNETCWVDSANLNPDSPYYGSGRCKPACSDDSDCQFSGNNPFGGTNLKCGSEKLADGTDSPKRCRANGQCMDNTECYPILNLPSTQPNLGYCDRRTFACKSDCRTGADPVSGNPFKDCRPPYACSLDAGVNVCRLETCVEQGGAGVACAQGEYCCGDDKNFDGTPDPCPPLAEQNAAGCYKAPTPPFCSPCAAATPFNMGIDPMAKAAGDAECAALAKPGWATCPNGSNSPNCSTLKPSCQYAGDRGNSVGINVCMMPTVNDVGTVPLRYGNIAKTLIACPANYFIDFERPQPNPMQGVGYCQSNADCSLLEDGGVSDAGVCEPDPALRLPDGGLLKACRCDAKSGASQCPNGTAATGPVKSFCKDAISGSRSFCIETAVCVPPRGSVYKATTDYGCGL